MDEGKILEFEEPYELLKDEDSTFSEMVKQTGTEETERLKQLAEESHQDRAERYHDNDADLKEEK